MKSLLIKALEAFHLKYFVRSALNIAVLLYGFVYYFLTKRTPYSVIQAFTHVFCLTSGASNDIMTTAIKTVSKPYPFEKFNGLLGSYEKKDIQSVSQTIHENGYYVFPQVLSDRLCKGLLKIGNSAECTYADESIEGAPKKKALYDEKNPLAIRYFVPAQTLIHDELIQEIISDASILGVAQEYLGSKPILDHLTMWWSTSINKTANEEAAQMYHFDLDRIRWLKFFFYITEVGPKNGPHCYISKSHRRNSIPSKIMRRGYVRLADEELKQTFPHENFIEFTGAKGTIIAEDTRGLHKGKVVDEGHRLLFQIQFTNSLFAGSFKPDAKLETYIHPHLKEAVKKYPKIYSYYK